MIELLHQLASTTTQTTTTVIDTSGLPKATGSNAIATILNIVFALAASIALLMVVLGGFRYIVANGDPNATSSAKNTILYAIIGLIVVITAYSIVTFVVKGIS
jgi:hypothetical protein